MESLYITDNGLVLKRRCGRIVAKKSGKSICEYRINRLRRLVIFGNNQVTTDLLSYLAKHGIDVSYLTARGRLKFHLVSPHSRNIFLRIAQFENFKDESFCLRLAQAIVRTKIRNQRAILMRYKPYREPGTLDRSAVILDEYARRSLEANSLDQLRGFEGNATKKYFKTYGSLIKSDFTFTGRKYHPPPDPVNALLSFGYTLVTNELVGLLEAHGFDPFIGFFHKLRYGRVSLATDLVEQFRAPVIDRLVLYLINKKVMSPRDFQRTDNGRIQMTRSALKTYLANYEQFVSSHFKDKHLSRRMNFRKIFKQQVRMLEGLLLHNAEYTPYLFY